MGKSGGAGGMGGGEKGSVKPLGYVMALVDGLV